MVGKTEKVISGRRSMHQGEGYYNTLSSQVIVSPYFE